MTDVLWVTPSYPWVEQPSGGIFYQTQARALSRLGLSCTVVNPTPWAPWPLPHLRPRWHAYASVPRDAADGEIDVLRPPYLAVPGNPAWASADRLGARAAWSTRKHWADARLVHGHYGVAALAAWRLAERARLPLVITFHGDDANILPDAQPQRRRDLRQAAAAASLVIAVSGALARRVEEVTGVKPVHLPLGSDHHSFTARRMPRNRARQLLRLPEDRVIVLFVGFLLVPKGVRELADALLGLGPPFLGVFVGGGPEIGYGMRDPRAAGVLEYRGERAHEEVATYMSAADVLVLPSYHEGMPTVLVEAGSLGLPVIASSVGGIPELLADGCGTLLPEVTASAISVALTAFVAGRERAESAAVKLHERVHRDYDVDRNAVRLLQLYRTVVPDLGRPSA